MIILNKIDKQGNATQLAIPYAGLTEATPHHDEGSSWIKYWTGHECRSAVVLHTLEDIRSLVYWARHGNT